MQACSTVIFAVSQLVINYLSSTANPTVAKHLYMMPELVINAKENLFTHSIIFI